MSSLPSMPSRVMGLHHVALWVTQFEACEHFYVHLVGMRIEWRPDPDNVYLNSGSDNLALHRAQFAAPLATSQRLDHIGFILATPTEVDAWHDYLVAHEVAIKAKPRSHRDGARSFYCSDPDGTLVQFIYHPPLSQQGV